MLILGLDVSTSITGYCILRVDEKVLSTKLVDAGAIITSRQRRVFDKADSVRRSFMELAEDHDFTRIFVEENLQAFRRGFSSAKTLSTLARFNGIVSFLAEDIFATPVDALNVNTARAKVGLKIVKTPTSTIKEQVLSWVMQHDTFSGFDWPKKTLKSGPRKGKTINAPECFDIADAAIVALAGAHFLNNA